MIIKEIKKIENCLEGKNVWDLYFDELINTDFLAYLGLLGKLVVHEFNPKPYFTLIVKGKFTLKGSVGNRSARLLLPDNAGNDFIEELSRYIADYDITK